MATISSAGVGSGLDVASIVSQLMSVERQPLTTLQTRQSAEQSKLSAFGQIRSALDTFQTALNKLTSGGQLGALSATSSDTGTFTASAASGAASGSYQVTVDHLAQAHKLASGSFASADAAVGTGTLHIDFGSFDGSTFTTNTSKSGVDITIGSGQNTLSGVRDAINAAGAGVTASIVNDGTGSRLVISSTSTGAANGLRISATDADGNNLDAAGLSQLAYDPAATAGAGKNLSQTQAALDAGLTIDGIAITSASNQVEGAIEGLTLNLVKGDPGVAKTLTVGADKTAITDAVKGFVDAWNSATGTLRKLTAFVGAGSSENGILLGDSTVRGIQTRMRSMLNTPLSSGGAYSMLSDIGVAFQSDGTLALDSTKLSNAVDTNLSAVTSLFDKAGSTTDSLVAYKSAGSATQAGSYAVNVTQVATQGTATGSTPATLAIVAGVNDSVDLTVNGQAFSVTLGAGVYASADALASELQTKANAALVAAGSSARVAASQSGGALSLTSTLYGSSSSVTVTGGIGATALFGTATSTNGVNVAGTIDGVAASGSGQTLTALSGNATGLAIDIRGGVTGARDTVTFSEGFASQLSSYLDNVLQDDGLLQARTDGLDSNISRLGDQQDALEVRLAQIEARYRAQFTALDTLISNMNATSTFLTQQIAALPSVSG